MNISLNYRGLKEADQAKNAKISVTTLRTRINDRVLLKAYRKAFRWAPHDTGALRQAIYMSKGPKNAGIRLRVPRHPDGRRRAYMLWHHGRGIYPQVRDGPTRPKTGKQPDFMVLVQRYMELESSKLWRRAINRAVREPWGIFRLGR